MGQSVPESEMQSAPGLVTQSALALVTRSKLALVIQSATELASLLRLLPSLCHLFVLARSHSNRSQ